MSRTGPIRIALIVLGLLPVLAWAYVAFGLALSYQMHEQGARKLGYVIALLLVVLAALTPALIGGLLMVVGAWLLNRKPAGACVAASAGILVLLVTVAAAIALGGANADEGILAAASLYVLLHCGQLVWLWRGAGR